MLPFRIARTFGISLPASNAVHVWKIVLDRPAATIEPLAAVLDKTELARARRLWEGPLRSRFIVAHAATRHILAHYLRTSPGAIEFDRLASGKPCVRNASLSFNLSHSGGLAICAVSSHGRVGVDVEQIRPISDADNIVAQLFAPAEAGQYAALPPTERVAAWFSGWTRKEAFLKALGEPSQRPFNSFEVDLSPDASRPRIDAGPDAGWSMRSFSPALGFIAAVAGDYPLDLLDRFEWPGPIPTLEIPSILDTLDRPTAPA